MYISLIHSVGFGVYDICGTVWFPYSCCPLHGRTILE